MFPINFGQLNTVDDVLNALNRVAPLGEFKVFKVEWLELVRTRDGFCPLCWMACGMGVNLKRIKGNWPECLIAPTAVSQEIANAADLKQHHLRTALMRACKLV